MSSAETFITELVRALAWPAAGVVAALVLRPLIAALSKKFLEGGGTLAVNLGKVGIEVATATTVPPDKTAIVTQLPSAVERGSFTSMSMGLVEALVATDPAEVANVDLKVGRSWLTSRLFLLSAVMPWLQSVDTFTFEHESTDGVRGRYLGSVSACGLRAGLARRYPYYEAALAAAMYAMYQAEQYGPILGPGPAQLMPSGAPTPLVGITDPVAAMPGGRPNQRLVESLVGAFLSGVQTRATPANSAPAPAPAPEGLVQLDGDVLEAAEWVDGPSLSTLLGDALETATARRVDSTSDLVADVLRQPTRWVGITDDRGVLLDLIDRPRLAAIQAQATSRR